MQKSISTPFDQSPFKAGKLGKPKYVYAKCPLSLAFENVSVGGDT